MRDSPACMPGQPEPSAPARVRKRAALFDAWLAAGLIACVLAFQAWTALTTDPQPLFGGKALDYNNRLMHGFLAGHLYLPIAPDPRLLAASDPYDPAKRPADAAYLHDGSFYRGHFYAYFGVTPVVVLLLPWRLLTGHDLPQVYEVVLFTGAGFLAACALWLSLRRRYFPESGPVVLASGILVLGTASMTHAVLRRSGPWEAAIAPGYCFAMLALLFAYWSGTGRRRAVWLFAAGICYGLAVGSRPVYAAGAAALAVPFVASRRPGRLALAFGVVPVGLALAWYNFARFGSPFEFGNHYMLNAANERAAVHFSLHYLSGNLRAYFLAPLSWSHFFPFVGFIHEPSQPAGYYGMEYVCGLLASLPASGFAFLAPLSWLRRDPREVRLLKALVATLALFFGAVAVLDGCFWAATARYMVDFAPELMLLACVGMLGWERFVLPPWRAAARLAVALAAAFSAVVGILLSFQLHDLLRSCDPAAYSRIAHASNRISFAWDRLTGAEYGPLEMTVVFPEHRAGAAEPLVATGAGFLSDYLFVHYLGPDLLRFGLEHTARGAYVGPPVHFQPGVEHALRIEMGSLYPPPEHPYFDGMNPAEARLRQKTLRVVLDGRIALEREAVFYDAARPAPSVGAGGDRPAFSKPFSGRILACRRLPRAGIAPLPRDTGALRLRLIFPPFSAERSEPLVSTGDPGRGDLVFVRYLAAGRALVGFDHWGSGGPVGAPFEFNPAAVQEIQVDFAGLHTTSMDEEPAAAGKRTRITVRFNGRTVLDQPVCYFPCDPGTVSPGLNAIGASTADAAFTGNLIGVVRR